MNIKRKHLSAGILFFLAISLIMPGCRPPETTTTPSPGPPSTPLPGRSEPALPPTTPTGRTNLDFNTISSVNAFIESHPKEPRIEVIASKPDSPIKGISPEDQERINAVDFSGNFVLIAFHGWTYPGNGIEIREISQGASEYTSVVRLRARFQETTEVTVKGVTTPYHIVQISKEQMVQFGEIEFILSDSSMEKDFVTGIVNSFPLQPGAPEAATLPPGNDLVFDTVARSDFSNYDEGQRSSDIQILTSKPVSNVKGVSPFDQPEIESVDFSQYFVIIAFLGLSSPGYEIRIRRVWQDKNMVYLLFHARPPQKYTKPMVIFPYHAIKINKEQMLQNGEITFKLLEQHGKELASTSYEISK